MRLDLDLEILELSLTDSKLPELTFFFASVGHLPSSYLSGLASLDHFCIVFVVFTPGAP